MQPLHLHRSVGQNPLGGFLVQEIVTDTCAILDTYGHGYGQHYWGCNDA